ncbi:MAG: hypothetical protein CMJ78_07670 [Planctomycetaceae bacterium]|nr:hypothetical protein [Planctomycetaceae bacterium]
MSKLILTRLDNSDELAKQFVAFEKRNPQLGVHVGFRRDCGSTMMRVAQPVVVDSGELKEFVFDGAIANYPNPDVEEDNVNYLDGIREIGVRCEYTDGRDRPRLRVSSIDFEGPFYETWPPASHSNIFIESDHKGDPPVYAREIIRAFATRAYRRPITQAEEATLVKIWKESFSNGGDLRQSIKDVILVILTSPQFLFLIESSETPKPEPLDSHELASKLSYFLWNAAPDSKTLALADRGQLAKSLDSEIERMIKDPRFEQFTSEFGSQWLSLDKFDVVEIDRKRYPKLTRDAKVELRKEPVRFLEHLIRHDLPLRNLVQSDFIVANEVVANYYGLGDRTESGFKFVAIKHDNQNLGGVLSQASILSGLSDGREANPVKRGAWVARKIVAEPPEPPPPNVPELDEDTKHLSLRERLERHRNQPGCAKCHSGIDPWGVPFEAFDAGGLFKNDKKVDARSTLPDKTEVASVNELKQYFARKRIDQVAFSFMKHLTAYAIGRDLTYNEIEFLKEKSVELKAQEYRMQDMIRFVVKSPMFLEK